MKYTILNLKKMISWNSLVLVQPFCRSHFDNPLQEAGSLPGAPEAQLSLRVLLGLANN